LGSGIRDPGSEIRDPEKTYSGSRIQGSKRHRIRDPGSGSATLLETLYAHCPEIISVTITFLYLR
jgi:hypothetical protein